MKLQLAYDLGTYHELSILLEQIEEQIDIIEIGTPLVIKEGVFGIQNLKNKFPKKIIFADLKIMDAGKLEAEIGFDAGADIVSVLGLASNKTISGVKESAIKYQKKIMVDMINHHDPINQWFKYKKLGMDFICMHTAHDDIDSGNDFVDQLKKFYEIHGGNHLSLAGGINPQKILKVKSFQPEIMVVGSYITESKNPQQAVKAIQKTIHDISVK